MRALLAATAIPLLAAQAAAQRPTASANRMGARFEASGALTLLYDGRPLVLEGAFDNRLVPVGRVRVEPLEWGARLEGEVAGRRAVRVQIDGWLSAWTIFVRGGGPASFRADVDPRQGAWLARLGGEPGAGDGVTGDGAGPVFRTAAGAIDDPTLRALYLPATDDALELVGDGARFSPRGGGYALRLAGATGIAADSGWVPVGRVVLHRAVYGSRLPFFAPGRRPAWTDVPSGWCSRYAYSARIDEAEMVRNADWLADNLARFGLRVVQLGDGWQGGLAAAAGTDSDGRARSWDAVRQDRFPRGMRWLADYVKAKGLTPGIWIAPFATSDSALARQHPDWFIRTPEGAFVDGWWVGTFAFDLTVPGSRDYQRRLFRRMAEEWGYDYFTVDGQPMTLRTLASAWPFLSRRVAGLTPALAFRMGLDAVRDGIGDNRFLLASRGAAVEGIGFYDGARGGADARSGWDGVRAARAATLEWYWLHRVAWYADPDAVTVRPEKLSLDEARLWATMLGMTGQVLTASDTMYALPEERVELLRRILPAAPLRPVLLYRMAGVPRVWNAKLEREGRRWDVVALVNWDSLPARVGTALADLGLAGEHYVYDFWGRTALAAARDSLALDVPPRGVRLLALAAVERDRPVVLSTSRHLTQGLIDLREVRWYPRRGALVGVSSVVGGDPYRVRVAWPVGAVGARVAARADASVRVVEQRPGFAELEITAPASREVRWQLTFAR